MYTCVCVRVRGACVCMYDIIERERERQTERETEREKESVCVCACACECVYIYMYMMYVKHTHTHTICECIHICMYISIHSISAPYRADPEPPLILLGRAGRPLLAARQGVEHLAPRWPWLAAPSPEHRPIWCVRVQVYTHTHTRRMEASKRHAVASIRQAPTRRSRIQATACRIEVTT